MKCKDSTPEEVLNMLMDSMLDDETLKHGREVCEDTVHGCEKLDIIEPELSGMMKIALKNNLKMKKYLLTKMERPDLWETHYSELDHLID